MKYSATNVNLYRHDQLEKDFLESQIRMTLIIIFTIS